MNIYLRFNTCGI